LLLVHSFGLSSASKPDADGIDVICTSNKNNTGNCRSSNNVDGLSSNNVDGPSTLLACTNVSSDLIECSRSSAGLLVHYDCVKSLSISNYQKLFSCQENSSSGNVDVNQFIADEDGSDVLSSGPKHNNKRLLAEGKLDESSADSASKIFIDAINMNIIDTNTSSPASSASDSFANGF
jgi:hypothetical protein